MKKLNNKIFQKKVLAWYELQGRKDLPWQKDRSSYPVWVSEIMLQQTQVNTVIPYFQAFMKKFPTVKALAEAKEDEVLHHWTGLGYYARARNLHKTAKIIQQEYKGKFPQGAELLQTLPGIGRSTAGAIASFTMNERAPILDGNVKRVLARFAAVEGWSGEPKALKTLWDLAEYYTPHENLPAYTQAMMDLGAMICTRTKPQCDKCPLAKECVGYKQGNPTDYPGKKAKKALPEKETQFVLFVNGKQEVLLEKRAPAGLWGGLWCFPEYKGTEALSTWCKKQFGLSILSEEYWPTFRHTFSHFHLDITPLVLQVESIGRCVMENAAQVWYNPVKPKELGFAAPTQKLLQQLIKETS